MRCSQPHFLSVTMEPAAKKHKVEVAAKFVTAIQDDYPEIAKALAKVSDLQLRPYAKDDDEGTKLFTDFNLAHLLDAEALPAVARRAVWEAFCGCFRQQGTAVTPGTIVDIPISP